MKRRVSALILMLALLASACARAPVNAGPSAFSPADAPARSLPAEPAPEPEPEPEPEPVVAHLMVAGDVMSHMPITKDAYVAATGEYDYSHMLSDAAEQLARADYAVANLETVLAGGPDYSGFPRFNSPDGLARSVKAAGFDLLSTANNHTRDQGMDGIFRTLNVLDEAGIAHVGTYRTQEEREENSGVYVADAGGVSVAFLSYTYGLNGFRLDSDKMFAVNLFNLDYYTTLSQPNYELLTADLEAARAMEADLIAVIIHWGVEYQNAPNRYQTDLARFLVEQGADLVLGGHPHVLQPYETITVAGPDGEERKGFVCYSLGNFLSNQYFDDAGRDLAVKTTAILDLELTRYPDGRAAVTGVSYTPYFMLHRNGASAGDRRYLVDVHKAMAAYEAGDASRISRSAYRDLQNALAHCHDILGEEGDAGLKHSQNEQGLPGSGRPLPVESQTYH